MYSSRRFVNRVLFVIILVMLVGCRKNPTGWWTSAKIITDYGFKYPNVTGDINGTKITVKVPNGTDVTHLVADFSYNGSSITVGSTPQVSGQTANNFSNPVTYTVNAKDGSSQEYTVTVTEAPKPSSKKAITNYGFIQPKIAGTIIDTSISVNLPWYTNVRSLIAFFNTTGVSVKVGTTPQVSGKTVNNFSKPVVYTVTAQDSSTRNYTVTVNTKAIQWTRQTGPGSKNWSAITSSSDGSHLAAVVLTGYIWTSTDGGNTWTKRTGPGSKNWSAITSSSDGSHLAAVANGGYIWTSADGGKTWTQQTGPGSKKWSAITSSSDGSHLVAVVNGGYIWTSTDGGNTWTQQTGPGFKYWSAITSSSDGSHLAAAVDGGYIWTSTDRGKTWTKQTGPGSKNWQAITSSSDGSHLAAVALTGYIWTSTDGGNTWTKRTGPGSKNWQAITSSSDGSHLAAAANSGGYIWTSADGGNTWTKRTVPGSKFWQSITSSSDGSHLAALNYGGYIWTGQ